MLRQLLRTGVAGRSLVASLASPAALASAFASAPVVAAPQRDFAKRRVERRSKKIVKMPDAVDLHQIRMQREARYIAEDEAYVEPRPSPIGDALINAHTILERTPIVIPKIPQWELTWLEREDRMSALGTVDLPMAIKKGVYGKNTYHSRVPTGIDYLPNYTEDDAANNRQSIYRKIDRPLYLIVKVKNTSDRTLPGELWQFPVGNWRAGETLRKAAERGVFYSLGEVSSYYLGNAPVCALEQPVTDSDLKKEFPAVKNVKSFYHHALYLGGKIELEPDSEFLDYAWVAKEELGEYFTTPTTAPLVQLAESVLFYDMDSDPEDYPHPIPLGKPAPAHESDSELEMDA